MGFLPAALRPAAGVVLCVIAIICVFPALFALAVVCWSARDWAACRIGYGPNRVGPFGLLQPVADGIKALIKEDIVPLRADAVVHFLAPVVLVVTVFMGFAVLPMGRNMVLVDMDAGLLFFFAMGAATELSVFMAGWSSRNKYSLLGAMRAIAQMISYEVVLLLSSVAVVMIAGSLSLPKIVAAQNHYTGVFPHWYVFTPWGLAGFVIFVDRRHGGDQPFALRPARRRIGDRGRIPYRILRLQVRALLPGRIRGDARSLRASEPRCFWADGRRLSRF